MAFADVAGWSRLVEANELEALRAWNTLRSERIDPKILEHGGRLVDTAGDAVFVEFSSAVEAVNWALDLQRQPAVADAMAPGFPLRLRIGINVCDMLVDNGRLVGDGVNIASRIHQLGAPGEIVVTEAVREHVHHRIAVAFHDLGERQLKNIGRPIRTYRVEAEGLPAPQDAGGSPAAMRTLLAINLPSPAVGPAAGASPRALHWGRLQDCVTQAMPPASGGQVIQRHDNGLLIAFAQARPAVQAALAIQQAFSNPQAGPSTERAQRLRIGVQMGEAMDGDSDAPGSGASVATRLTAVAGPGEIVVSSAVHDQLTPVLDADMEDLGDCYLSGMDHPVRAYRLGPPNAPPQVEPSEVADELRPTIAVIPFTARGDGPESLGEIVAEELIAALSRSADLYVVSRLSTTVFRGRGATLGEVSAHLRANYVLSGAYRAALGSFTLAAELAEAKTGRVVWARDLKGSVAGVVEGRDELIDRIVAEVSRAVTTRELERTQSQSLSTLETYTLLIGASSLLHRLSSHDFHRARDMLQAVAARAPRHAVPQALLAKWHVLRVWQSWSDDPVADTRQALDCTRHALDNDSQCALALAIDGFVHANLLKALDVAQQRYDLALRVNPNESLAWLLSGVLHAFKGEGKPAVKHAQRALRLSPLDPHRWFYDALAASAELSAGRYERAIDLAQRSLRANRMHTSTFRALAISQWQFGQHDEARATVAALMKIEPTLTVTNWLERSPSSGYPIGQQCAQALRNAGVPA